MIQVVIVEDEPWVRKLIISEIPWDRLGMKLLAEVDDGPRACEVCLSARPELVITDIRIPGMNGLELIRRLRPELTHTRFLIITGHADFHYAQEAVRLGVTEYLLKPVRSNDISTALEKVSSAISRDRASRRRIARLRRENETLQASLRSQTGFVETPRSVRDPRIHKAVLSIRDRIAEEVPLAELASSVGMSRSSFSSHFRLETGKSYVEFLSDLRAQMGAELLKRPELSISEVASMVGYADANYFARVFRTRFSKTPTDFRRELFDANQMNSDRH